MRPQLNPLILGPGAPWSLPGSSLDIQFTTGRAAVNRQTSSISSLLTTTRASTGYAATSSGLLVPFLSNIPRITDLGLLVEQAATNVVLWNRDLTNAAWTKSNITAALNQTGADDTANSATSLTATAGNGTCLQAITLASSARFQSAYVKRITGTGTINMTMDNGATWTAITVTAAYTKLTIPTQTLANPTVGFRIVTSGDAIAVDLVGNETGTFATSPIATTTVAVTRAADFITVNNSTNYLGSGSWSALANVSTPQAALSGNSAPFSMDDGTTTNMFYPFLLNGFLLLRIGARGAGSSGSGAFGTNPTANVPFKTGQIARPGATSFIVSGGTGTTLVAAPSATLNRIVLGSDAFLETWNGTISRFTVWKSDIGNTAMTALTQ